MMSWKDYFYFQKGDKIAIILLLVLIVISGGIYFFTLPGKRAIKDNENSEVKKEFEAFLSELKEDSTYNTREQYTNTDYPQYNKPKYPYQEKLKPGETIELNSADSSSLKKIPKIGSGFANRIIKYRESLGGYISIEQLKEVWGMDDYLYNDVKPYITLIPTVNKLRINSADFNRLVKHPYLNYKQAQVIVDIRERKGNITSVNRLSLLDEFTQSDIERLTPYLSFD